MLCYGFDVPASGWGSSNWEIFRNKLVQWLGWVLSGFALKRWIRFWIYISWRFTEFFNKFKIKKKIAMVKQLKQLRGSEVFISLSKVNSWDFCFRAKRGFKHVLVDICILDPDPEPGSQNVADATDPDSKHCSYFKFFRTRRVNCENFILKLFRCLWMFSSEWRWWLFPPAVSRQLWRVSW